MLMDARQRRIHGLEIVMRRSGKRHAGPTSSANCVWGGIGTGTFQAAGTNNMTDALGDKFIATMSKF